MSVEEQPLATINLEQGAANADAPQSLHPLLRDVRAVLFDVGGTLLHPDWHRLAQLAEEETGRTLPLDEVRRITKVTLQAVDQQLLHGAELPADTRQRNWVFRRAYGALGFDEETCDRLIWRADESHSTRHLWCELDQDAPRVLTALKRAGLRIAVISNTEDGRLQELLELAEIAAHFDLLIDSYLVGHRKPDAAIFHLALERMGLAPADAVYVGDLYGHDVLAAQAVGLRAILIDPLDLYPDSDCSRIRALSELIGESAAALR